jgi:hypothetical protein
MKNLEYHEADQDVLEGALEQYAVIYQWWLKAIASTDSDRELARRNLASIRRLQRAIK